MQKIEVKKAAFDIKDLLPIGMTLVVLGIGLAYGLDVLSDQRTDMEKKECEADSNWWNKSDSLCYNSSAEPNAHAGQTGDQIEAVNDTITGVAKLPNKLPTIVTIIVAAVIIGILVRYLVVR